MLILVYLLLLNKIVFSIKINGAQFIVKKLLSNDIKNVFGYCGGPNLKLFDELSKNNITIYSNRHEQYSGHSCEAFSKITNKLGVLITSSGPGLTNAVTAINDAYSDGIPMLVLSGQVNSAKLNTCAFQECDATSITKSCVKKNLLIKDIKTLIDNFDDLVLFSLKERKGPVHLDICSNVFTEEYELNHDEYCNYFEEEKSEPTSYEIKKINKVYNLLKKSKSPIVIIGKGVNDNYKILRKFIEEYNLPLCSTLHALGSLNEDKINYLGMVGMHGTYQANNALYNADLIIGLGNRFDDRTIGKLETFGQNAKNKFGIIHIDNSEKQIELVKNTIKTNISIKIDSKYFLEKMLELNKKNNFNKGKFSRLNSENIQNKKFNPNQIFPNQKFITIPYFVSKLSYFLNKNKINPIITTGVGVHQMQVAQYYKFNEPNKLLTSGSFGTMGTGVPFAIGAKIAKPEELVICMDGDGSFQMSCSDLATIKQYNIPIKIIIFDNNKLQMVHYWQKNFYNSNFVNSEVVNPDFVKLAKSYGIDSYYCENTSNLEYIFKKIKDKNKASLIHVKIKDLDCLPFLPPNKSLNEMILE